jgi:drug/metabolite transporter (DMT)-like permease
VSARRSRRTQALLACLVLVAVTALWGSTFVVVKDAISRYPTLPFLALRFALGLLVMALVLRRPPSWPVLKAGVPIGLALAGGYLLQTFGLVTTSAGNAGLITGLFVVFTPLLGRLFGGPLRARTIVAVTVALAGTALLAGGATAHVGLGDLLVLGCAVCFALQIVLLGRWAPGLPAGPLTMVQMATCAVLFAGAGAAQFRTPDAGIWLAVLVLGVFASALSFLAQTWAQSHLAPTQTALVLAMEPGWALAASVLLAGQRLNGLQGLGAALLLGAIVLHEVHLRRPDSSPSAGRPAAPPSQPGERGHQDPDQERGHVGNRHLPLELDQDECQVREPGQPGAKELP